MARFDTSGSPRITRSGIVLVFFAGVVGVVANNVLLVDDSTMTQRIVVGILSLGVVMAAFAGYYLMRRRRG